MRLNDQIRFVRQNVKKNRMRVFMTMLATAMGCAFLIVLASVGFGLQKSVVEEITEDQLLTEIEIYAKETEDGHRQLTDEDVAYLESVKHVKAVSRVKVLPYYVTAEAGGAELQTRFLGMLPEAETKAGAELAAGRMPETDREVLVGYHLAEQIANGLESGIEDVIGATLTLGIQPKLTEEMLESGDIPEPADEAKTLVTIVGVKLAPTQEWMQDANVSATFALYDHMVRQQIMFGEEIDAADEVHYDEVKAYADDAEDVKGIAGHIRDAGYLNHSIADQMEQVNVFFLVMKIGLILVGTIALLIASIGIYNTMTMAVTERSQDIGIMKAIGMHPNKIRSIFLIESSWIGLTGAAIGTATAYVVGYAANLALPIIVRTALDDSLPEGMEISYIPPSLTLLCVCLCVGIAVLSGLRPAVRATRVDVLKALRRDV